jgi:3-methylcrotonyl-CoA carboxylase alpha subunit
MAEKFLYAGDLLEVSLVRRHPRPLVSVGDVTLDVCMIEESVDGRIVADIDGRRVSGWRFVDGDDVFVRLNGRSFRLKRERPGHSGTDADGGGDVLRAPMPGVLVSIECEVGQSVARGQTLVVIESMKMQTAIAAPRDGVVCEVHFASDASFEKGAALVSLLSDSE